MWTFPWIKLSWYFCSVWDKLRWLNWFWQYLCEGFFSFSPKVLLFISSVLQFMGRKGPFAWDVSLENSADSYLYFRLALIHSVHSMFYLFFLYQSPSSFYAQFLMLCQMTFPRWLTFRLLLFWICFFHLTLVLFCNGFLSIRKFWSRCCLSFKSGWMPCFIV